MATILLVEDNEMNRDMLSRRLARRGHTVILAEDGAKGRERAHSEALDLILMDVNLPDADGLDIVRELKADEATRGIPILVLTAHAMTGDRQKALDAGSDDYDTKPIEFARLLQKIEALLESEEGDSK